MHRNRWKDLEISEESQPMTTNLRNSLSGSANRIIVKPLNFILLKNCALAAPSVPRILAFATG